MASYTKEQQQSSALQDPKYCYQLDESLVATNQLLFDQQGNPLEALTSQFSVPEYDECISKHECSCSHSQKLTGFLFLYNSKICFFSRTGLVSAGFRKGTIVSVPLSNLKGVNSIKLNNPPQGEIGVCLSLEGGCQLIFMDFKSKPDLDIAMNFMLQLFSWQKKLAPTPEDLSVEYIRMQLNSIRENDSGIKIIELDNEIDEEEWEIIDIEQKEIEKTQDIIQPINVVGAPPPLIIPQIDIFEERSKRLKKLVLENKEAAKAKWTNLNLFQMSAKEIFILFFGNHQFEDEKRNKFESFSFYFASESMKEKEVVFSDLQPKPPLFFSDLLSTNQNFINHTDYSERTCTFTHIGKDTFSPPKTKCAIKEKIYFLSPSEFIVEKDISFSGILLSDCFQPQSICHIKEDQKAKKTTIRNGFYIKYLKDTWFKSAIERTAFQENINSLNAIIPLFEKYTEMWIKNRDSNSDIHSNNKQV